MADGTKPRPDYLPPGTPPANHGRTPAAWTTILLVTLGSVVCALGFIFGSTPLAVAGGVVVVVGLVVGKVMQAMGLGQRRGPATTPPPSRG
jgi:hypothetical protein